MSLESGMEKSTKYCLSNASSGQAIVEFAAGLVAVLVLVAGLLQVASLSAARTDAMVQARKAADSTAMLDIPLYVPSPFIKHWDEGPDRKAYTRDDDFSTGDMPGFRNSIVDRTSPDESGWDIMSAIPRNDIATLRESAVSPVFGLVQGEASRSFEILPAFRKLIYNAETITVKARVWMTRTRGIY